MNPLTSLALATFAFVGTHLALSHPLRAPLVQRFGERGFSALYALVALLTLAWMIIAYRATEPGTPLWQAPNWWFWAASALMLPRPLVEPARPDRLLRLRFNKGWLRKPQSRNGGVRKRLARSVRPGSKRLWRAAARLRGFAP